MPVTDKVFSEYEVTKIGIKLKDDEKADINECVGSAEEEMEVKTVTKKCRGRVTKERTRGTGKGTVKLKLHIAQDLLTALYGMNNVELKDGITAHGIPSLHPEFTMTELIIDEDDNEKLKAYPNCSVKSALSRKVENGGEEVNEVELEISVNPDKYGFGMYEAVASDLTDETVKTKWMESFEPSMTRKVSA